MLLLNIILQQGAQQCQITKYQAIIKPLTLHIAASNHPSVQTNRHQNLVSNAESRNSNSKLMDIAVLQ